MIYTMVTFTERLVPRLVYLHVAIVVAFLPLGYHRELLGDEYATYLREGNQLYEAGEYTKAEEKYLLAKNEKPNSAVPVFNIGNTFFQREDFLRAIESYQEALPFVGAERELESRIKYNLATTRARESERTIEDVTDPEKVQKGLDLLTQAITGYRDVLELDPQHAEARHNLAVAQLRVKKLFDDLKRLQEEAEKNKKEGQSPVEVLRELIAEEKQEIHLTNEAAEQGHEERRLAAYAKELASLGTVAAAEPVAESRRAEILEKLRGLENDPNFDVGAAEVSTARKEFEAGGSGAEAIEEAIKRVDATRGELEEKGQATLAKDREEQENTRNKALGLVAGLKDLISPKPPPAPAGPGQGQPPQPPVQPPPPEVAAQLDKVAALTSEAAEEMQTALERLEDQNQGSDDDNQDISLSAALTAQRAALEKLEKALEEAEQLPGNKPPPPQEQQGEKDQQDQDQKGEDQNEGEKQDQEPDNQQQEGEQKEQQAEEKKEEQLSREETERLLRKFLEEDAARQRERKERRRLPGGGRRGLEKDW